MIKIFYLFIFSSSLLFGNIKNIPFGINDVCDSLYKSSDISVCLDNNTMKWASYSLFLQKKNVLKSYLNKDKKYHSIYSQGFNLVTLFNLPIQDKISFVLSDLNLNTFLTLENNVNKIISNMLSENNKVNIIQGIINSDKNIKFQIDNNIFNTPKAYFIAITNIDKKEVEFIFLLDFNNNQIKNISLHELKKETKTDFLYKLD